MPLVILLGLYHKENYFSVQMSVKTFNNSVEYKLVIKDLDLEKLVPDTGLLNAVEKNLVDENDTDNNSTEVGKQLLKAIAVYFEKEAGNYFHQN